MRIRSSACCARLKTRDHPDSPWIPAPGTGRGILEDKPLKRTFGLSIKDVGGNSSRDLPATTHTTMDVQRNSPGGSRNLRPTGPTQGPARSGGERGRSEQAGDDGVDRTATPADRQARLAALRQRNARRAQQGSTGTQSQGSGQGVQESGTQEEQGVSRSQKARITAIRMRRARVANAEGNQSTEQTSATPAGDQVDLSGGGLTVDQARNRIARLQNFIANQLGQGPEATESTDEAVPPPPPEPPVETPVELPPAQEEGKTIEQMLQRIARLISAFENGWVPGQPAAGDTPPPPPGPEGTPAPETAERAPGAPTVASPVLQAPVNVTLPAFQSASDLAANAAAETFTRAGDSLSVSSNSLALSAGAAALSNAAEQLQSQSRAAATPERLNELRAAFEAGTLNTAELVERAANSLLSPETERARG